MSESYNVILQTLMSRGEVLALLLFAVAFSTRWNGELLTASCRRPELLFAWWRLLEATAPAACTGENVAEVKRY